MPRSTSANAFRPTYAVPPGETLVELLDQRAMTQTDLARRLGVSLKHTNQVIKGAASISAELSLGLEKVLDVPASFWLNRESLFRAALARASEAQDLSKWIDWAKLFPIKDLKERGFISGDANGVGVVEELLRFLGIATPEAWQETAAAYRRSRRFKSDPYALAAWLRAAEIEATQIEARPYDGDRLVAALKEVRGLTCLHPREWHPRLIELCAGAGVAFVLMDTFKGARANGATRWLTPRKALVQLSLRYAWEDIFWFTFFHEAGHVLLHRKKEVFLEGLTPSDDDLAQQWDDLEREADLFASRTLIPHEREPELATLAIKDIPAFANELGVAPAIVVGRMQHEKHLLFSQGNDLRRRLTFAE
jgi:HTH-type transcriptional regulator / antitoxin HigA